MLEVGDNAKKKYLEQSKKCDLRFLIQAIDLSNDCDLKYKTSKNQRLLVELTLMQLASITFDGEKKNNKPYIIAALHFNKGTIKAVSKNKQNQLLEIKQKVKKQAVTETKPTVKLQENKPLPKPKLNIKNRRPSALSLTSIDRKKKLEEIEVDIEVVPNKPTDDFAENKAILLWKKYSDQLNKKGKKSASSVMRANQPKIIDNNIHFIVASGMMKSQLEQVKYGLMEYIHKNLNNYKVELIIEVNEEELKKYAYTPQEKYQKLLEKNSAIDLFKKKFDLDL